MTDLEAKTPSERAAVLAYALALRGRLSLDEAATLTGVSRASARQLLCVMSRVIPVRSDRGQWLTVDVDEVRPRGG